MTDGLEDWAARFGPEATAHIDCPFCGARDFIVCRLRAWLLFEVPTTCATCGRVGHCAAVPDLNRGGLALFARADDGKGEPTALELYLRSAEEASR